MVNVKPAQTERAASLTVKLTFKQIVTTVQSVVLDVQKEAARKEQMIVFEDLTKELTFCGCVWGGRMGKKNVMAVLSSDV